MKWNRLCSAETVLGDLNITSCSPWFAELKDAGSLIDTRDGFGLQPSWPVQSPLIVIPIDHVLVSRDFQILSRRIGEDIGSDHWPVVVDLHLAPEAE